MMKRLSTALISLFTSGLLLMGCGYKEYETPHDSGTLEANNFTDLLFESKSNPKQVSKRIPEFCIYGNKSHYAKFQTIYDSQTLSGFMSFNADYELQKIKYSFEEIKSEDTIDSDILATWDKIVSDLESKCSEVNITEKLYDNSEIKTTHGSDFTYKGHTYDIPGSPYLESIGKINAIYKDKEYHIWVTDTAKGKIDESKKTGLDLTHEVIIEIY